MKMTKTFVICCVLGAISFCLWKLYREIDSEFIVPLVTVLLVIASLILIYQTFRWMDDVRDGINGLCGKRSATGEEWKEQYKDESGGGEDDAANAKNAEGIEI